MNQGYILAGKRSCASPQKHSCRLAALPHLSYRGVLHMSYPQIPCRKMVAMACAFLLCGSMGLAQVNQQPNSPVGQTPGQNNPALNSEMNGMNATGQASPLDKMFVRKALQGGMAEVQLGQLTLQKSNNDQVKQFAQKMIDDHTKLGEQMKPVAQQLGVPEPNGPSKRDKATMAKLQSLSGSAYN